MLALVLTYWRTIASIGAGAVLGAFLMFAWAQAVIAPNARQEGRELERAAVNARAMRIIQERNATNETVGNMDRATLCAELGGRLHDDGTCQ